MRHRPHLYLPGSWEGDTIPLDRDQLRHLRSVLRYEAGEPVTYTNGVGRSGAGVLADSSVERGAESDLPPPAPRIEVAVATPKAKDRQRFIVEKLQELGAATLTWIRTERGQVASPPIGRSQAWAVAALEQSRGAWLMSVQHGTLKDFEGAVAAHPGGTVAFDELRLRPSVRFVIGPEGGLTHREWARFPERVDLGPTVLRTETAALMVVALSR